MEPDPSSQGLRLTKSHDRFGVEVKPYADLEASAGLCKSLNPNRRWCGVARDLVTTVPVSAISVTPCEQNGLMRGVPPPTHASVRWHHLNIDIRPLTRRRPKREVLNLKLQP